MIRIAIAALALVLATISAQAQRNPPRPGTHVEQSEPESSLLGSGKPCIGSSNLPLGCTPKASSDGSGGASDKVMAALAKPFQDLSAFLTSDAEGAIALATQIPDLQDGHGQQCWMAMQLAGEVFRAHPVPLTLHAMTDFEALRLLGMAANKLCANTHCTVVFADATSMAQAASPIPLAIPSLHDLCAKIPQISVAPPVAVAAPAPSGPQQ